jgi:hypothetical protein
VITTLLKETEALLNTRLSTIPTSTSASRCVSLVCDVTTVSRNLFSEVWRRQLKNSS